MFVASQWDVEIRRAEIMVRKDHRQRWVYRGPNGITITDQPIPYKDAVSVAWMPIVGAVSTNYRGAALAHNAIGALQ